MLNRPEKEYFLALAALRNKAYITALEHFDRASEFFRNNREFVLLHETTRTLLVVKEKLAIETELMTSKEI